MDQRAAATDGWTDRYWTSRDGLRLHFRDYAGPADRPPILCLHGLTRNSRDFEDFAARYAGEWRVIAPDFRGRGLSQWDRHPENYKPPIYAADTLQLLDELQVPEAIFVGTSLGGLVTMAMTASAPQRIAAVILNDVGPELDSTGLGRIGNYVGKPATFDSWDSAAAALAQGHSAAHPDYGAIAFDYDMAIADNFRAAQHGPALDAWPYYRALSEAPLLIVRGQLSDLLSGSVARAMVGAHPDAQLVTVPNVGHPPDLTEPDAIAAIDRLLERVSRGKN